MIVCPQCGTENPEEANFCKTCRTVLVRRDNLKCCLNGHQMEADWNTCPLCGAGPVQAVQPGPNVAGNRVMERRDVEKPARAQPTPEIKPKAERTPGHRREKKRVLVGFLVTYSTDPEGVFFEIRQGRYLIGSSKHCDISLPSDKKMSSRHAVLTFSEGKFHLKDQTSKNGTYVNGRLVKEVVDLKNYDLVKMGATIFQLLKVAPPKSASHPVIAPGL